MSRRGPAVKKVISPDARYNSLLVAKLINKIMERGKKRTAEGIVYGAMDSVEKLESKPALTILEQAIKNSTPLLRVKPRRIGGATYQVPVEVEPERGLALSMRWLIDSARGKSGKSMAEKLASEIGEAAKGQGATVKKREDTHKMAEANRAFAHFRW